MPNLLHLSQDVIHSVDGVISCTSSVVPSPKGSERHELLLSILIPSIRRSEAPAAFRVTGL
jgi:hypothetical protein